MKPRKALPVVRKFMHVHTDGQAEGQTERHDKSNKLLSVLFAIAPRSQ